MELDELDAPGTERSPKAKSHSVDRNTTPTPRVPILTPTATLDFRLQVSRERFFHDSIRCVGHPAKPERPVASQDACVGL